MFFSAGADSDEQVGDLEPKREVSPRPGLFASAQSNDQHVWGKHSFIHSFIHWEMNTYETSSGH